MFDPKFKDDPSIPTVRKQEEKTFRYARMKDDLGTFVMPKVVAEGLGENALYAIVKIIQYEINDKIPAIVRDEVTQAIQRALDIRFPRKVDDKPPIM